MNIRDIVGPLLLAAGVTILAQSFWGWYKGPEVSEVGFVAPISKAEQEPLLLEVDFKDDQAGQPTPPVVIETAYGQLSFSNEGGTLSNERFVRHNSHTTQDFVVLSEDTLLERESRPFLIALDEKSPFYYELKELVQDENTAKITYTVKADQGVIEKTFTVDKLQPKLDLSVTVTPASGAVMRPRLIWMSPSLQEIKDTDAINAVAIDKSGHFIKTASHKLDGRKGYFAPEVFGTENKYFVHAMIKDTDRFVHRAYYKGASSSAVLSILETKPVTEKTTWNLSFYIGPKDLEIIRTAAPRLEKTLDYGIFSWVTKGMLVLLNLINKYTGNYGWSIILITLLVQLLLLPLSISGEKKMRKMQDYQKKLNYIQQKYKNDPEALAQAREEMIKKYGMPGVSGCLPVLMKAPIFTGLYGALNNSIELYRAPFVGWINDLSMPDQYYLIPVLITGSVLFSGIMSQGDKVEFKKVVPVFALALLLGAWTSSMAAGLGLFILSNALLHGTQVKIQRMLGI